MNLLKTGSRPFLFLKNIYLRHFRNYEETFVSFDPGINVIFGENAQGKTNLLEAISLLSTGRSFRTPHLSELIQEGKSFFYLEAEFVTSQVIQKVRISFDGIVKKLKLDASEHLSFSPLLGTFPSILSVPSDIDLITDTPLCRRKFLNLHLAQSDPLYVHHLARFSRAMKQRNCLLKSNDLMSLDCFENEMAHSAEYLFWARKNFLEQLKIPINRNCQYLSSSEEMVEIRFSPTYLQEANSYKQQLVKTRKREMELGVTLQGPHRDDLPFFINNKMARTFASEGQKRTMITALRFSQWEHLAAKTAMRPLFGMDDFEDTLDPQRQNHLAKLLQNLGQVFVTTPSQKDLFPKAHFLEISEGELKSSRKESHFLL